MIHLFEKKQRRASGVHYVGGETAKNYAVPVTKKDVPRQLKLAIEGSPIMKTNKGVELTTVPGSKCGCFGGKIDSPKNVEFPWLYIFIPPTIPNPAALNYTARRGHPPAAEIPNMTQARKRELRNLCKKVGWELNTEDLWDKPEDKSNLDDDDGPGRDWADMDHSGDSNETVEFYKKMEEMRSNGWYSYMIAPKGNFTLPEKWEVTVGQENDEDKIRRQTYDRRYNSLDSADDVVATYGDMRNADDDFSGYGRVTESTKVTLTIGQIKKLVAESRSKQSVSEAARPRGKRSGGVTTKCYGKERTWASREEAEEYFEEGLASCDPGSSEYDRYLSILSQLERGENYATDEDGYSIGESQKVTLTFGQLKKLVKESAEKNRHV